MDEKNIYEILCKDSLTSTEKALLKEVKSLHIEFIYQEDDTPYSSYSYDPETLWLSVPYENEAVHANLQYLSDLTDLDYTDHAYRELPEWIFRLKKLRSLALTTGLSEKIISGLKKLASLRTLELYNIPSFTLPDNIGDLSNLEELHIAKSNVSTLPESLGNLNRLRVLSCSSGSFTVIPDCVFKLQNLISADFSNNRITAIPDRIRELNHLLDLILSGNNIERIPASVCELEDLVTFDIGSNFLSSLPVSFMNLNRLERLNLESNQFKRIPKAVFSLENLIDLDVSDNTLTSIPDELANLKKLQKLQLSMTNLGEIPEAVFSLKELIKLDLSNNQIETLPEEISELCNLEDLDLARNEISYLPEGFGDLKNLRRLNIECNELNELAECFNRLTELTDLNLSENRLSDITNIQNCLKLKELNLSVTDIRKLPALMKNMTSLAGLDISYTEITSIPKWLDSLSSLNYLDASGLTLYKLPFLSNLFEAGIDTGDPDQEVLPFIGINLEDTQLLLQPASLFRQPYKLIEEYYKSKMIHVSEAKIIFIGNGKKGKTYTLQRILHDDQPGDYRTEQTHGINICDYHTVTDDGKDLKITFWDFGGQHIMHSMHQCFLTERTGYVIFLDTRDDDGDQQAEKWIKSIKSFAPNSRILVYANLWDDTKRHRINEQYLMDQYGVEVISCSSKCAAKEEFAERVTRRIVDLAQGMDSYVMEIPEKWNNIRNELLALKNSNTFYITYNDYFEICHRYGEDDQSICMWLLELFNDMGECFSFGNKDIQDPDTIHTVLDDYRVLEPKWLTKGIYSVINRGEDFSDNGEIQKKSLFKLLKEVKPDDKYEKLPVTSYSEDEVTYILEIMRKFSMSYEINSEKEFIPSLILPSDNVRIQLKPDRYVESRKYELRYAYLPDALIHQIMVECYRKNVQPSRVWSRGFVYESEMLGIFLVVDGNGSENILRVNIYTLNRNAVPQIPLQWMLNVIRSVSQRLNLSAEEWVLPDDGITDQISIDELNRWLANGKFVCTRPEKDYYIPDLLYLFIDKPVTDQYVPAQPKCP